MALDYVQFVSWGFMALLSFLLAALVSSIKQMNVSISELNIKIAVIISRVDNHEEKFDHHDKRIMKLEDKI